MDDKKVEKKKLFNPQGNDAQSERKIILGNTTNLFNLNNIKYKWAKNLYRVMLSNFWIPEKVDLTKDVEDYKKLSTAEKKAFDEELSFLTFLDSLLTNALPSFQDLITAPEVSIIISIHTFQEAIHSQSYSYVIESIIPANRRDEIYDYWRLDPTLLERNQKIAKIFENFRENPTPKNFITAAIANYALEGVYFYNGFMFFYNLASANKMLGVADMIKYINRDEATHLTVFKGILTELKNEYPDLIDEKEVYEIFQLAAEQEIIWSNHILGNKVMGITEETIEKYTKYLTNIRLQSLGFEKPLYPGYDKNPYEHLERIADTEGDGVKAGFFETTNTSYSQSTSVDGWNDF